MFFSFIIIISISQYENWDPILAFLEKCVRYIGVKSNESAGYRNADLSNLNSNSDTQTIDNAMTGETKCLTDTTSRHSISSSANPTSETQQQPNTRPQSTTVQNITNNRRFDSKNYRSLKKSDNLINSSSSTLSSHYSDEDHEQSQSLIEAEDNAFA